MRPIDTLFIILAVGLFIKHSKQKYFMFAIPILFFAATSFSAYIPVSLEPYFIPAIAIVACVSCLSLAPISLLLLFTHYGSISDALLVPILWLIITILMDNLSKRLNSEFIPEFLQGLPIKIISLGILYYIFNPLSYI